MTSLDMTPTHSVSAMQKVLYGSGNFARFTVVTVQAYFVSPFLLEVANISPTWVSVLLLVKQFYDGITDPIVGKLSDNTKTRWGRRRPWIILASIPAAFLWILTWWSPPFLEDEYALRVTYFFLAHLIFSTINTAVAVPYFSLLPDLVAEYNGRTIVVFLQQVFGLAASIIFSFLQTAIIEYVGTSTQEDYSRGYLIAGVASAVAIVFFSMVSALFVKERPRTDEDDEDFGKVKRNGCARVWAPFADFFKNVGQLLVFKEYMMVVSVFVLCFLAVYFTVNNLVLFIKYVAIAEAESSWIVLTFQLAIALSFFFWTIVSNNIGKKMTYYFGALIWSIGLFLMFFIQAGQVTELYFAVAIRSFGAGVGYLVPYSMLPDVIEIDEIRTGKRREGLLYAIFILIEKFALAIGLSLSTYILGVVGYEAPAKGTIVEQSYEVQLTLRLFTCLFPIVFLVIAALIVYFYPVTKTTAAELRKKKAEESQAKVFD